MSGRFLAISILAIAVCFVGGLVIGKSSGGTTDSEGGGSNSKQGDARATGGARLSALGGGGRDSDGGSQRISQEVTELARSGDYGMHQKMGAYFKLISEAESSEMPALIETLRKELHEEMGSELFVAALAKRWAAIDAPGAFDALLEGRVKGLDMGVSDIIAAIAAEDPRGAWEQLLAAEATGEGAMANSRKRGQIIGAMIGSIGQEDPALITDLLSKLENPHAYQANMGDAFASFASKDPVQFLDQLDSLPITQKGTRDQLISEAFTALGEISSETALQRLASISGSTRERAEIGLAAGWARSDPAAALEWVHTLTGSGRARAEVDVIELLAQRNPRAAAEAFSQITSPRARTQTANDIAQGWVGQDQEAAVNWARTELEGRSRQAAYGAMLLSQIHRVDFEENFDVLLELAEGSQSQEWGRRIFVNKWASSDPEAAVSWAIGRGENRDQLISMAVSAWANSDPQALEQFAASQEDEHVRTMIRSQLPSPEESESGAIVEELASEPSLQSTDAPTPVEIPALPELTEPTDEPEPTEIPPSEEPEVPEITREEESSE